MNDAFVAQMQTVSFVGNLGSSTWHGGVSDGGYAGICSGSWGGD